MTTKILAFNTTKSHFEPLTCDDDGKLLVSSSGGGAGGDASAELQQEQIDIATASNLAIYNQLEVQTDRLLYDTDIIANTLTDSNLAVCSRLDTIEVQLDKLTFTSANLHVRDDTVLSQLQGSNLAINTKLGLIEEVNIDLLESVDGISAKMNTLQIQSAKYTIEAVASFAPDTVPAFTFPPAGIAKDEGWYYKNLLTAQVSQLYFYSYLNPGMSVAGRQFAYQLNDITMSYCVVRLIAVNSGEGLPTLAIYSRPQGSGDAVPGFIRSRKVYNIPTSAKLTQGMQVMLYWGVEPSLKLHPGVARIQLQLVSTIGPALGTEQLAFLSINTDSASLAGNSEYIVSHTGFQYGAELIMNTEFTGQSSVSVASGDASSANQVSSNTAICSRLDSSNVILTNIQQILGDSVNVINYGLLNDTPQYIPIKASSTGNLYVSDINTTSNVILVKSELETINGVLSDLITGDSQMYVRLDGTDDSVQILATDIMSQAPSALLSENGKLLVQGDFYQASQPVEFTSAQDVNLFAGAGLTHTQTGASQYSLDVNINNTSIPVTGTFWQETQPVSIAQMGFTAEDELIVYDGDVFQELQTLNGKVILCDTGNVSIIGNVAITSATALSVTESNPITGFALETTLGDIKTQTDLLTFIDIESNTNNLKVIDTALNQQLSQFSFFTGEDDITDLRVHIQNEPIVELKAGTTVGITGNVAITSASALDVSVQNSSLDVHCFGSADNINWHHLKTTGTGELVTHSQTRDGAGNSITSTNMTGAETYRGLDVVVKGSASVVNPSGSQLAVKAQQYGSYGNVANNVASILPSGVTAGIDVSAWAYFLGAYEDYYAGMPGTGSLRLQYSFDNTTYYDLFGTTISPGGVGTPRTANIQKQDIPGINWIRFKNDSSVTLASVTITLLGASI